MVKHKIKPGKFDREIVFSQKYLFNGKVSDVLKFKLDGALNYYSVILNGLDRLNQDHPLEFGFSLEDALDKRCFYCWRITLG